MEEVTPFFLKQKGRVIINNYFLLFIYFFYEHRRIIKGKIIFQLILIPNFGCFFFLFSFLLNDISTLFFLK